MCKCEIGECVHACIFTPATGMIECEIKGKIHPKKECEDFVQCVELDDNSIDTYSRTDIHVKCPKCGEVYDEYDIEYEKRYIVECEECGTKFAFDYCPY